MNGRLSATLCALVGASLLVPASPVAAQAAGPLDCPQVRQVADVSPGDTGVGYTVSRGTEPEPFDVEIVDVLDDGVGPGIPLIVVEVASPELDRVGGIWAGMSGSPVYVDGELIGAVAYGFSLAPSKLGGVTPASAMLEVPGRPTTPPPPAAASVTTSSTVQQRAVAEHGMTRSAARSMAPLDVPVRLAGPGGAKFDEAAKAFEARHPGTKVVRGASSAAPAGDPSAIVAGGNIGVSLAYGDFTAVGVGTVTTVCDGVVTAFGHPMLYDGATHLGMHGASAVRIVDDATLGGYKLANVTGPVGTIDQDRLAAVAGRVGVMPRTTPITTTITTPDDGRTTTGRTDAVHPDSLFDAVLMHGWANFDQRALDDLYYAGTTEVAWTISGVRRSGATFQVTRANRHADTEDLSTASLIEVASAVESLHANPFEEVRITGVDYAATARAPYRALRILRDRVTVSVDGAPFEPVGGGELELVPGGDVRVRVPLRPYRGDASSIITRTLRLEVPQDAEGYGAITVTGGPGGDEDAFHCLYFPEDCTTDADGLGELIAELGSRPRNDDLVASLVLHGDEDWDGTVSPDVTAAVRLSDVVAGYADVPVFVMEPDWGGGEEPEDLCPPGLRSHFVDVDHRSPHAGNIACAWYLELTSGVATDPPRFAPARAVTRGQAASFLARALDAGPRELPGTSNRRFTDLAGSPHQVNAERLAAAGILRGKSATRFDPETPVTREQVATLLVNALGWSQGGSIEPDGGPYFRDVGGVHAPNVDAAYELGLVLGRPDGRFDPRASTRRDQMATLIVRFARTQAEG